MSDEALLPGAPEPPVSPPRRRPVAPFVVLAIAVVLGALFFLLAGSEPRKNVDDDTTPLLGKPAPTFSGTTLDGGTFDLAAQRGRVVVLNFFTSSCVPCKLEHPELTAFAREQAALPGGAIFVSLVVNDDPEPVRKFFADNGGGDWPVVFAQGAAARYGVSKVPETWFIDGSGRVVKRLISETTSRCLTANVAKIVNPDGLPIPKGFC